MRSRQIIICVGLYRSASTWAFNVIAEIARRHGPVQAIYADDPAGIAAQLIFTDPEFQRRIGADRGRR